MTERLRKSGLRAIHPVVDVTNYVMLELGQPLHAYDLAKLNGAVRPRYAVAGESLTLLDERKVELNENTVVITDESGPIGLAGIMGGLSTMVTMDTADVFFEAAFWPPAVMAGVARSYGMHTDASVRFERGVDPEGQARAVERAVELLVAIAGGQAGPLVDDVDTDLLPAREPITLRAERLEQVLGAELPGDEVSRVLDALGLKGDHSDGRWRVTPPSHRFDLSIEDDLVEEVARIYGYDRLPETTAVAAMPLPAVTELRVADDTVADALVGRDYQEIVTYSFIDPAHESAIGAPSSDLVLSNPISSEMAVMRSSLLPGLLTAAAANLARQRDRVRIFEIGKTYHGDTTCAAEINRVAGLVAGHAVDEQWGSDRRAVDFFDAKADVMAILSATGAEFEFRAGEDTALQPGQCADIFREDEKVGVLGKVHPSVAQNFDVEQDAFVFQFDIESTFAADVPAATAISKYPSVRRDIAVVVADDVSSAALVKVVKAAAPELVQHVTVFDVYRGSGIEAGRKSIALGLILQETSRTLTDVDADAAVDGAVQKLKQEFNADLRE